MTATTRSVECNAPGIRDLGLRRTMHTPLSHECTSISSDDPCWQIIYNDTFGHTRDKSTDDSQRLNSQFFTGK